MNEFTKEELSMMADGIVFIKNQCVMNNDQRLKLDNLDEKLCVMINNYCDPIPACEHKWLNMAYAYMQCEKCFSRKGMNE